MPQAQGALRAVFAGIGRVLNVTDKVRGKPAEAGAPVADTAAGAETIAPETVAPESTAAPESSVGSETVSPETSAGPEESVGPETVAPETASPESVAGPEVSTGPESVAGPEATTGPEVMASGSAAEPPLPNYDELTIASVRARLRNLSLAQLGDLVAYEKAHAARSDFLAMFERRIAKVESEK